MRVAKEVELKSAEINETSRLALFTSSDMLWFHFTGDHNHIWSPEGAEMPTRPRQIIASPERMLPVFWSPLGFALVEMLPRGACFDPLYFCLKILCGIVRNRPTDTAEDERRRMVLHFDNAIPYTAHHTTDYMNHN
jgi:hypothetical protein